MYNNYKLIWKFFFFNSSEIKREVNVHRARVIQIYWLVLIFFHLRHSSKENVLMHPYIGVSDFLKCIRSTPLRVSRGEE